MRSQRRTPSTRSCGVRFLAALRTRVGRPAHLRPSPTLADSAATDARGFKDINDTFFRAGVRALELAFEGQFHYACFYAYAKLKEQEVKVRSGARAAISHHPHRQLTRTEPSPTRRPPPAFRAQNIAWIATCQEHGVYSEVDRVIPVFSRLAGAAKR